MSHKKAALSEPKRTVVATPPSYDALLLRPTRKCLKTPVLEELWSIWRANPRVPSVKSRRSWAISRNASPQLVDNWFIRRRTYAKKTGQPIPNGSYDLPLVPPVAPKREQSAAHTEPELEANPDSPSDDTLIHPPGSDNLNDLEASSDTVFDEDVSTELKRSKTPAYKEVPHQPRSKHHHLQPKLSSTDLSAVEGRRGKHTSFGIPSSPVCNQGRGKQSNFTCILCSTKTAQGAPDDVPSDFGSRANLIPGPRLDFSPDTLSELSAIPFLFRTPPAVFPDNAINHRTADYWATVEDELGRLVNSGNLDFSFLDVPHLASMKLHDSV